MKAKVISHGVFVPSPRPNVGVMGGSYYTGATGLDLVSVHSHTSRSDTVDVAYVRRSPDNGRTWSEVVAWPMSFDHSDGTGRRHVRGGYVDPQSGRYIQVWTEGVLPNDDPLEGMRQWKLHYSVSQDGGATQLVDEQIVHTGEGYDEVHHLPGVTVGRNCAMIGDLGEVPLTRSDGVILVPVQSSPTGADGMYENPGAGFTYTDCLLLMGTWRGDGGLDWTCSERVVGDPQRSTRGLIEPTIAELADGRILMVMRGSNDARLELPGHRERNADPVELLRAPGPGDGRVAAAPAALLRPGRRGVGALDGRSVALPHRRRVKIYQPPSRRCNSDSAIFMS